MTIDPYASPQTPPPVQQQRRANVQAFGKVLSVVAGIVLLMLAAFAVSLLYALSWIRIAPP